MQQQQLQLPLLPLLALPLNNNGFNGGAGGPVDDGYSGERVFRWREQLLHVIASSRRQVPAVGGSRRQLPAVGGSRRQLPAVGGSCQQWAAVASSRWQLPAVGRSCQQWAAAANMPG